MRIEQLFTLMDARDGIYRDSNKVIIKKANSISISNEDDHVSIAKAINPNIKTASYYDHISLIMPSALSEKYSDDQLEKVASSYKDSNITLEQKVQKALVRLAAQDKPLPDVDSIISLASKISNGTYPGLLTLRFAQFGGTGGMSGNEGGSFKNFSFQSGDVNAGFGRWQANSMFDEMLGSVRRNDRRQWDKSTEGKLSSLDDSGYYSHKYADENARNYNMTWSERIRHKNLERLKRMFEERAKKQEKENTYSPEYLRLNETINPRHYESVETFLSDQRGEGLFDFAPKHGRLDEVVPSWHSQLRPRTLRRESSKLEKVSVDSRSDRAFEYAPGRRRKTDEAQDVENAPNYAGGSIGAAANILNQESNQGNQLHQQAYGTTESEPTNGDHSLRDKPGFAAQGGNIDGAHGERDSLSNAVQNDPNNLSINSNGSSDPSQIPNFDSSYVKNDILDEVKYDETMTAEEKLDKTRVKKKRYQVGDERVDPKMQSTPSEDPTTPDAYSLNRRVGPGQGGFA